MTALLLLLLVASASFVAGACYEGCRRGGSLDLRVAAARACPDRALHDPLVRELDHLVNEGDQP